MVCFYPVHYFLFIHPSNIFHNNAYKQICLLSKEQNTVPKPLFCTETNNSINLGFSESLSLAYLRNKFSSLCECWKSLQHISPLPRPYKHAYALYLCI